MGAKYCTMYRCKTERWSGHLRVSISITEYPESFLAKTESKIGRAGV